jgi:hypothetical protein
MSLGYAFTDAEDISPMTSSVAESNFDNVATNDSYNLMPATSNYEVPHRFTLRASYGHNFFGDYETRISLFGYSKEGQPQSFVMRKNNFEPDAWYGRHLLYVPTGVSDPNVVFSSGFDTEAFFAWVDRKGLKPGMQKRNAQNAKWSTRFDMYFSQELPTFIGDTRAKFYVKIYNLGNLLNDEWGIVNDAEFYSVAAVAARWIDEGPDYGKYQFNTFYGGDVTNVYENRSLWDVRLGLEFIF